MVAHLNYTDTEAAKLCADFMFESGSFFADANMRRLLPNYP